MNQVTTYHNPNCGTSRNVLAMIRAVGIGPQIYRISENTTERKRIITVISADGYWC